MTLVHKERIDLMKLVAKLTVGALTVLGDEYSHLATLRKGTTADITVFDPTKDWIVSSERFISKGKNTPIEGVRLKGKVVMTFVAGRIVYEQEKMDE